MKQTVYLETSFLSFYYDARPDSMFRRNVTRDWWKTQKAKYDVYTSMYTINEISAPVYPQWRRVSALAKNIDLLEVTPEIRGIIKVYIEHNLMPKDDAGDAAHLAVASYHEVDYLLTWNCRHLANANKFEMIRNINMKLGLVTPALITPEQLFRED